MRRKPAVAALLAAAAALAGCGGGGSGGGGSATTAGDTARPVATPAGAADSAPEDQPSGEITVFAAASLTKAFTTLGRRFQAAHPDVTVRFTFGASAELAAAIGGGTPADVFAAASAAAMQPFVDSGSVARAPTTFVRDRRPGGDEYQVAPLTDSTNIVTAAAFVDFVVSQKGRQVLKAAGFQPV